MCPGRDDAEVVQRGQVEHEVAVEVAVDDGGAVLLDEPAERLRHLQVAHETAAHMAQR